MDATQPKKKLEYIVSYRYYEGDECTLGGEAEIKATSPEKALAAFKKLFKTNRPEYDIDKLVIKTPYLSAGEISRQQKSELATLRQRYEAMEAENKVLRAFIGIREDFPPITKAEDILNTPISEIMREPQTISRPLTAQDFIEIAAKQKRFNDYLKSRNQITVKDVDKSE